MSMRRLTLVLLVAGAGGAATCASAAPVAASRTGVERLTPEAIDAGTYRSAFGRHKVIVDAVHAGLARSVAASRRLDYGSFSVLDVDDATAARLVAANAARIDDTGHLLLLNAGVIDATAPDAIAASRAPIDAPGMMLVQFAGPVRPQWHEALLATGVEIVSAMPSNAYLVYGAASALRGAASIDDARAPVQIALAYGAHERIDPGVDVNAAQPLTVQLYARDAMANDATRALIARVAVGPVHRQRALHYENLTFDAAPGAVLAIAQRPDVVSIHRFVMPRKYDERQDRIVTGFIAANVPQAGDHLAWLAGAGFTQAQFDASAFVVDVTDSGIDAGAFTPPAVATTNHFALHRQGVLTAPSRVMYARLEGTPNFQSTTVGADGHGTLNAHIVAGYVPGGGNFAAFPHADAQGFRYGLGVAPFARVGSSVIFDPDLYTFPDFEDLASRAYADAARISSNSWGADTGGVYGTGAQAYDALTRDAQPDGAAIATAGNQPMVFVFSSGNSGPSAATAGSPGTGKNVITVGASENVHAFGAADLCGFTDAAADSANDMGTYSSRGPVSGGRRKPDLVAPGSHVTGGVWQASAIDPTLQPPPLGAAGATFNASGICAGPGADYFPLGQQWYSASTGTSHSTPAVAGGAALVRQDFLNDGRDAPSPAMTKAVLMNSARHLTGAGANDTLWSNAQGMGLLDLARAFDGRARLYRDQQAADTLTATGQRRSFAGRIDDASAPLRVTLAWTDAPGPTSGAPQLNNLDLEVVADGVTYRGNVFDGAWSTTGGTPDAANNVESVYVPPLPAGTPVLIRVGAANILADGVPNVAPALDQDFALVGYDLAPASIPVLRGDEFALVAESYTPANLAADPGETVQYDLALANLGVVDAHDVVATLQPTGGVVAPPPPQDYGDLAVDAPATSRTFAFGIDPALACGDDVTATWTLASDEGALGTVRRTFATGVALATLDEPFDGVAAPALPAGWSATTTAGTAWRTVTTASRSAPNAAFVDDPPMTSDRALVSPPFPVASRDSTVRFFHRYALETTFDGAVLEIAIGDDPFVDFVAAGGTFTVGGYNASLRASASNPLGGRAAWSGSFNTAWQEVVAVLPPAAQGATARLRWRVGTDALNGAAGYFLDDVRVASARRCASDVVFAHGFE